MCHFITAALPLKADHVRLAKIAAEYGRVFTSLRNAHVQAQLPSDTGYFLTTAGHCDCGTTLGAAHRAVSSKTGKETAKLRRLGWSDAKIARHFEQQNASAAAARKSGHAGSKSLSAEEWLRFVREVLDSSVTCFGLLLHWYHSTPEAETVTITERITFQVRDPDPAIFENFPEDVFYQFI